VTAIPGNAAARRAKWEHEAIREATVSCPTPHRSFPRYRQVAAVVAVALSTLCDSAAGQIPGFPSDAELAAGIGGMYVSMQLAINPCMPNEAGISDEDWRHTVEEAQAPWPKGVCDNPALAALVPKLSYLERSILAATDDPLAFLAGLRAFHRRLARCATDDCIESAMRLRSTALMPRWTRLLLTHPYERPRQIPQPRARHVPRDAVRRIEKLAGHFITESCPGGLLDRSSLHYGFLRLGRYSLPIIYGLCSFESIPPITPLWLAEPDGAGGYRFILGDPDGNCYQLPATSRRDLHPPTVCSANHSGGSWPTTVYLYAGHRYREKLFLDNLATNYGLITVRYEER